MALFIDQKYLNIVSVYLENFKKLDTGVWVCRCPICGDSATNKKKTRLYFYTKSQSIFANCKNCDFSSTLGKFIEHVSTSVATEYRKENYLDKQEGIFKPVKKHLDTDLTDFGKVASRFSNRVVSDSKVETSSDPFSGKLTKMIDLPETHIAVQYCIKRKIPKSQYHKIYFIEHINEITKIEEFREYRERVKGKEPRIVLPFFDMNGNLTGVTCRDLSENSSLRYLTLKVDGAESLIFGVENIDWSRTVYVTEGGFDSMFLDNCIAVGGTGLAKLNSLGIDKEKLVIIFDNQRRQNEVVNIIDKTIKMGYTVLIWSQEIKQKDINSMMLAGENYLEQVKNRCYNGLRAKLEFNLWKKI